MLLLPLGWDSWVGANTGGVSVDGRNGSPCQ